MTRQLADVAKLALCNEVEWNAEMVDTRDRRSTAQSCKSLACINHRHRHHNTVIES